MEKLGRLLDRAYALVKRIIRAVREYVDAVRRDPF